MHPRGISPPRVGCGEVDAEWCSVSAKSKSRVILLIRGSFAEPRNPANPNASTVFPPWYRTITLNSVSDIACERHGGSMQQFEGNGSRGMWRRHTRSSKVAI